jgi:hypothetical protein
MTATSSGYRLYRTLSVAINKKESTVDEVVKNVNAFLIRGGSQITTNDMLAWFEHPNRYSSKPVNAMAIAKINELLDTSFEVVNKRVCIDPVDEEEDEEEMENSTTVVANQEAADKAAATSTSYNDLYKKIMHDADGELILSVRNGNVIGNNDLPISAFEIDKITYDLIYKVENGDPYLQGIFGKDANYKNILSLNVADRCVLYAERNRSILNLEVGSVVIYDDGNKKTKGFIIAVSDDGTEFKIRPINPALQVITCTNRKQLRKQYYAPSRR